MGAGHGMSPTVAGLHFSGEVPGHVPLSVLELLPNAFRLSLFLVLLDLFIVWARSRRHGSLIRNLVDEQSHLVGLPSSVVRTWRAIEIIFLREPAFGIHVCLLDAV